MFREAHVESEGDAEGAVGYARDEDVAGQAAASYSAGN